MLWSTSTDMFSRARPQSSLLGPGGCVGTALLTVTFAATVAMGQEMPADHGTAMSAPLFVPDLPVGTISVRLARPSMNQAITGTEVVGSWSVPGGKPGSATVKSGEDGRAVFSNVPVGATFKAKAQVDGKTVETSELEVPAEGGTRLLVVVGDQADQAMADMTGQNPHGAGATGQMLGIRAGKVTSDTKLPAGTVELKVLTWDGKPIQGAPVNLAQARGKGGGIALKNLDTDAAGVARFTGLERGAGGPWAAVVERNGLRIGTELFTLDAEHGASGELRVPEKTSELSVLRISAASRMMVEPREDSIAFLQNLVLENASAKAFDPGPRGLLIPLPDGFTGAEKLAGGVDVELKEGTGAILRAIVPPTDTPAAAAQVRVACLLETHENPEVEIVQPMPFGLEGGLVMIPATLSVRLSAPGLRALPTERDDNGNELRMYELKAVPAGQPLRLIVTGLPARPRAGKWVAGILVSLLVAAGVVAARRPRRAKPTAEG